MSSISSPSVLSVYVFQIICILLIGFVLRYFKTRSAQKHVSLLTLPFYILFVKGVVLVALFALNGALGMHMENTLTRFVAFVFDCAAASVVFGGALGLSGIPFKKETLLPWVAVGLFVLGGSTVLFDITQHVFPVLGPCFLAMEFLTVTVVVFTRPVLREETSVALLGLSFGGVGLASVLLAISDTGLAVIFMWQLAAALAVVGMLAGRLFYEKGIETQLMDERRKVRLFLNSSPFPILLTRLSDGQGLYVNSEAQRLFDLTPEDLKYFRFSSNFANPKDWVRLFTELREKAVVNDFEVKIQNAKTGVQSWFSLDARALEIENEFTLYTTFRDVTSKKDKEYKLLQAALTDPLTGLFNRRQFDVMAEKYIQVAKRNKTNFCLMMLDIDFFKLVNDTFGHEAGDMVLMKMAAVLKKVTRESDVLARYGGEEFVLFMPNTSQQEAYFAAERLRGAIEEMEIVLAGETHNVTISIGLSGENVFNLDALVQQADKALYIAKENGRNRTAFYEMGSEDI